MDIPQPPADEETRNIIDRLANFVARNGPEFEMMTKQKQRDNPRFQFLFGGEYYNYYTYRVISEQSIIKHKAMRQQSQQQQDFGPPGQQLSGNLNLPPDFHGSQQLPPQTQQQPFGGGDYGQHQGPPGGMIPGHGGPPPHMLQQRFSSPQQRPQLPRPMGDNINMSRPSFRGQQPQNQFGEFGPGPPGMPPNRGPPPHVMQQRFGPPHQQQLQQQRPLQPGGPSGINTMQNNFPGQSQFGPLQDQDQRLNQPPRMPSRFGPPVNPPRPQIPPPAAVAPVNIDVLKAQKQLLETRVQESELNLAAQQQVLLEQQKTRVEEALNQVHEAEINSLADDLNVDISEFDRVLEPIMESCTKESIANGKAWIFTHTSTKRHYKLLTLFLLKKTTNSTMTFLERLHIIYLINDVLHHCMRKGAEDLQLSLEEAVVPMFCYAMVSEADPENIAKLQKLYALWESRANYVSKDAVEKLKNYEQTWTTYKNELVTRNAALVTQVASEIQQTFEGYQAQHQIFSNHVVQNIKQLDQQIQQALLQQSQISQMQQLQQQGQQQQQPMQVLRNPPDSSAAQMMPTYPDQNVMPPSEQMGNVSIPDLSRPPPGFPPPSEKDLIPGLPYFELPAGLMVPLVKPEDDNYKPLDPKAIRLPPPCAPSEKLLQAVEAFYGPPSHDNPRDSEGWERLGLYEYYKSKHLARKQKEDDVREGKREKSRSPSPIRRESSPTGRSPPRRRYQSKSPTPPSSRRRQRSRSRSSSPSRSRRRRRSRSRSPPRRRRSATPPSFSTAGLGMERKLDESNKGHQLLKKMGWGGTGLGANEQGIEAPISGGDIRDKKDQFKGVGVSLNDPFESYRKSRGQLFIERMRARGGPDDRT